MLYFLHGRKIYGYFSGEERGLGAAGFEQNGKFMLSSAEDLCFPGHSVPESITLPFGNFMVSFLDRVGISGRFLSLIDHG